MWKLNQGAVGKLMDKMCSLRLRVLCLKGNTTDNQTNSLKIVLILLNLVGKITDALKIRPLPLNVFLLL